MSRHQGRYPRSSWQRIIASAVEYVDKRLLVYCVVDRLAQLDIVERFVCLIDGQEERAAAAPTRNGPQGWIVRHDGDIARVDHRRQVDIPALERIERGGSLRDGLEGDRVKIDRCAVIPVCGI